MWVTVPPAKLRSECCLAGDDSLPPPNTAYRLDLTNFLMSCPACGKITTWVDVSAPSGEPE